jgi:hypothetical protein
MKWRTILIYDLVIVNIFLFHVSTDYESRNAEIQSSPNSGDAENKQKQRTPRFHIKITYSSKGSSLDTRNVKQVSFFLSKGSNGKGCVWWLALSAS